jgi:hypothetical protein
LRKKSFLAFDFGQHVLARRSGVEFAQLSRTGTDNEDMIRKSAPPLLAEPPCILIVDRDEERTTSREFHTRAATRRALLPSR